MRKSRLVGAAATVWLMAACEAPQYDPEAATEVHIDTAAGANFSMSNKVGATLRQALRDSSNTVHVLVKVDTVAAPDAAAELAKAGLDVRTGAGDVYTASASAAAIRRAAELPFVLSLQLSETRDL